MPLRSLRFRLVGLAFLCLASPSRAQVDYGKDSPWDQRAESGPDAEVPGWFYNLGITGLRAQLVADQPKALLIKYVFPGSPADGHVQIGDLIAGAGGRMFREEHRNGYGENVFGAHGPISELARVLEECQGNGRDGKLALTVRRDGEIRDVVLDVGQKYGTYSATYPDACAKSDKVLAELLDYLVRHQAKDGSFGDPVHNTFAPLALLASGDPRYRPAVERNARYHSRETYPNERRYFDLINWTYMSAAIVLSEYYLATGEKWVLPELQEVHDHLAKGQYLHMSQINPKAKESHPDDYPKGPRDSHGGWGHNPGFEGYGPIAMLTGQGALAYSLMHRCGIKIDRVRHDAAYDFLKRGTGKNGYVWYGDKIGGGPDGWADMGRTGASGIANFLSPYGDPASRERALAHARVIGKHPQSFPDTHGSPAMGMAYTALGANVDPDSFRKLMDANRWWFTMAQCIDGSFYYQPNRDNAGYGSDSRMTASSVVAFLLTIPKHSLVMTGKEATGTLKPDEKPGAANKPIRVFILAGQSNMQGQGFIKADPRRNGGKGSLESLTRDPATADKFKHLLGKDGQWAVRDDVWIHYLDRKGRLTVGYGATEDRIGPELGFGNVIGEASEEPVLLIKLAWGGKSLAKDFRPPSSGGEVGPYYKEIVQRTKAVLGDLKTEFPEFGDRGYELAGFGWHQGWNDRINQAFNDEYEKNMANFIRDIRKDLGVKDLPFVIAETGMSGKEEKHPRALSLMKAQAAVAEYKEFQGNVAFVGTQRLLAGQGRVAYRPGVPLEHQRRDLLPHRRGDGERNEKAVRGEAAREVRWDLFRDGQTAQYPELVFMPNSPGHTRLAVGFAFLSLWCSSPARADDAPPQKAEMAGYLLVPHGKVGHQVQRRVLDVRGGLAAVEELPGAGVPERPVRHLDVLPIRRPERPKNLYSDIEGGLGWWRDTRFATETPKFIMGGVALNFVEWANGPGAGKGRDWKKPAGHYAIAQLSPWVLWPPDGLNLKQGTSGELFGYGYLPLPLTTPKKTTAGQGRADRQPLLDPVPQHRQLQGAGDLLPAVLLVPTLGRSTGSGRDVPGHPPLRSEQGGANGDPAHPRVPRQGLQGRDLRPNRPHTVPRETGRGRSAGASHHRLQQGRALGRRPGVVRGRAGGFR